MQSSKLQFKIQNLISPLLIICFAVVLRLIPHPANIAPITAMALFGGVYLNKRYALVVPLISMLISDLFLGFHNTMGFVYGSFLLTGIIGMWLKTHKSFKNIVLGSILSSVLFFIITNFGVWMVGNMYEKTLVGLFECYIAGLPFFRNTIVGDFLYIGIFFGGYELVRIMNYELRIKGKSA